MTGEPEDEPVLRIEHRPRGGPAIGIGLAQPQQPRQRVEPVQMFRFRVVRHPRPLQRLLGRPARPGVAIPDSGANGAPPGVEEYLSARRTAGNHRHQSTEPAARCQRLHGIGEAAPPSVGVLLGAAGPVLLEPDREGDRRLDPAFEGEHSRLQRRSPEIDGQYPTHERSLLVAATSGDRHGAREVIALVRANQAAHVVATMYRVPSVSPSGYYAWLRTDLGGMRVSGHRARCVQPSGGGMGDGHPSSHRAGVRGVEHGVGTAPPRRGSQLQFRLDVVGCTWRFGRLSLYKLSQLLRVTWGCGAFSGCNFFS